MTLSIGKISDIVNVLKHFLGFSWEFFSVYRDVYHECCCQTLFTSFKYCFSEIIDRFNCKKKVSPQAIIWYRLEKYGNILFQKKLDKN